MLNNALLLAYGLDPKNYSINRVHFGHINQSFQLISKQEKDVNYFLQKINPTPFTSIQEVMKNIEKTIQHQRNSKNEHSTHLELIHTTNNNTYIIDSDGSFWRLYKNLDNFNVINPTDSHDNIFRMGLAYGGFIHQMQAINKNDIFVTIPHFHNVKNRFLYLQKSIKKDIFKRVRFVKNEINLANELYSEVSIIQDLIENGKIPTRISHNDTKTSNVMIHEITKQTCVIDLDTVMPSSLLFDYGDSVRSIITNNQEDSSSKPELNFKNKDAYHQGFVEKLKDSMNELEINFLDKSCVLLPYIMGIRFLTDYLNGDVYFITQYSNQNLKRAQNQLQLANEINRFI